MLAMRSDAVRTLISAQFGVAEAELSPTASFKDDLNADSLDLTELLLALEERFQISIDRHELLDVRTVEDAIRLVETRLGA
jgi:acyl carrier protein